MFYVILQQLLQLIKGKQSIIMRYDVFRRYNIIVVAKFVWENINLSYWSYKDTYYTVVVT